MMGLLHRIFVYSTLLLLSTGQALAQDGVPRMPQQYSQFYSDYVLYNPASMGIAARVRFNVGSQLYGPWQGVEKVYNYYARAEIQLAPQRRDKQLSNHVLGLNFTGDREGDLLVRSRAYLQYAVHISLDESLQLSAGVSTGLVSHVVRSSSASAGAADTKADVNIGLWLYSDQFQFGIAAGQINRSRLQPIQEISILERHINVIGEYSVDLSHNIKAITASMFRWVPESNDLNNFDIHGRLLFNDKFSAGLSYRYKRGLSVIVGLENLKFQRSEGFVRFAYNAPLWSSDLSGLDTFEVIIGYNIDRYK